MTVLEVHQSVLTDPKVATFVISKLKNKTFYDETSQYLDQNDEELCHITLSILTFLDKTNSKPFLFAFYNKASKGECNLNISQKDTPGEEELYEDPVSLSFHASQLLFVIIILTIFAVVIIAVKKKSKINMIKLRSETCSALIKLGSVKKELTKAKESHRNKETVSEEP